MMRFLIDVAMLLLAALFGLAIQFFVRGLSTGRKLVRFGVGGAFVSALFGFLLTETRLDILSDAGVRWIVYLTFMLFYLFSNPQALRDILFDNRRGDAFLRFLLGLLFTFIFAWFGAEVARAALQGF